MSGPGRTVALVVAAGAGSRAGGALAKQFAPLAGETVLAHAVDHLRHPQIDELQLVIAPGQEDLCRRALGNRALPAPVVGGATRQQSVRNGLEALAGRGDVARVLIHDAARPFVPDAVVDRLLAALEQNEGAVPVLPLADSLALADGSPGADPMLGDAVPRDRLVRVQTPQAFRFPAILSAHLGWAGAADATDDAQVARAAGLRVATVQGDDRLDKLTFAEDFERAERRIASAMTSCTGLGFDVHAFTAGDHLWLGGERIAHERGLAGHSDADVVLHALTDALLGACGAGDIGDHFPPSDPRWRGAASSGFVGHAAALIAGRGGRIDHVDVTIICEAPRIGPHKEAIRANVAHLLQLPPARVSIKATTTERLGFTGRGEGIAAQAVATVRLPEEK
ncbi:bifunctional 2-C-methyl-D-erythritol 4-phosphate cytidylyltransferase/2-C-methyl-D-erythritol 2,4-cyclodiphosphate synthase [Sphingomonas sp.]|uniref:bifunctional 2-C-methyl-D-erythritol 4-phosphate cytidylyltransferase/2-C-methyl-D-erythritol 2,4-cyclodiphosphate synthase n=1 Tax=Sphingomonas sp. TaxID=28214 RepID=UPI002FCC5DCF